MNPLTGADGELLRILARGDFLIKGFRNADVRAALYGNNGDGRRPEGKDKRRQSAAMTRLLALLRAHGLIVKVNQVPSLPLECFGPPNGDRFIDGPRLRRKTVGGQSIKSSQDARNLADIQCSAFMTLMYNDQARLPRALQ